MEEFCRAWLGRYKSSVGGVYPEMKVSLKIFFAGVGTGIVLVIAAFALLSDPPPGAPRPAAGGWVITMSTNELQYKRAAEHRP